MAKAGSYGLKEVADVMFYDISTLGTAYPTAINASGTISWSGTAPTTAAYTFDSLKVSNIEVTAEDTSAKGGQGNPELIVWQYGKELTLTCEDALLSMETLKLMFGGSLSGNVVTINGKTFNDAYAIVGKTILRNYTSQKDEQFMFFIPKARVNVGGTLTMEAEGDPTTFEMSIKALSATVGTEDDVLIKFIKQTAA